MPVGGIIVFGMIELNEVTFSKYFLGLVLTILPNINNILLFRVYSQLIANHQIKDIPVSGILLSRLIRGKPR